MNKSTATTTKEKQKEFIFHLYRDQGFSYREIAKVYNVTDSKIRTVIDSKLKRL